jgi:toxin-antitoxin system PIN domain toxin
MRALLDINVIIALLDPAHVMHQPARQWMARESGQGWASCPITENGVVRIMAQPGYPNPRPAARVAERLAEACRHPSHAFWPESVSLLRPGLIAWERVLGPRQITDAYLLALSAAHGGRFVSFDRRISTDLVPSAGPANLQIINLG